MPYDDNFYTIADRESNDIFVFPTDKTIEIKFDSMDEVNCAIVTLRKVQDSLKASNYRMINGCLSAESPNCCSSSPYICDLISAFAESKAVAYTIQGYIGKQINDEFGLDYWIRNTTDNNIETIQDYLKLQSTRIAFIDFIIEQIKVQHETD